MCTVVDGSPCYGIICVVGIIVSQGYMVTGWGSSLLLLSVCVCQVLEVAREAYSCVVEAGVGLSLVLDSDFADAVFVCPIPTFVVLSRMYSGFGKMYVAFVCFILLV